MIMTPVNIYRTSKSDQGVGGVLICAEVDFSCRSLELPWMDNRQNISCISTGSYIGHRYFSNRFGEVFMLENVKGRSAIIGGHSGNVAGDTAKGFKTHSLGCILLAKYSGVLWNQKAILCSRPTIREFMQKVKTDKIKLTIKEVF